MNLNFALLRRRWHAPLLMATGFLPIPLVLCAKKAPDALWAGLPVAALYVLFSWLCIVLPGKRRLAAAIIGAAAIGAVGLWLLPWLDVLLLLLIPVVYGYLLFAALAYGGEELPLVYPCLATILHIAAQFVQIFDDHSPVQMPLPVIYTLRLAFVVYGFLALLSMNRISLNDAAAKGSPAPLTVKRRNLLLTIAMGCLTMLIACFPAVVRFFQRIWDALVVLLKKLWAILCALLATEDASMGGGMGGMPDSLMGAAGETSRFWAFMEKIMMVVGILVAAALAAALLVVIWRRLKKLLALCMARLMEYAQAASEDYHDEISDTREGGVRSSLLKRFARKRDPLKGIDETKLSPRERIRFYYLKTWLKRPDWEAGSTVRENLASDAAGIYEKARYSQHDVSEAEAAEFGRKMREK